MIKRTLLSASIAGVLALTAGCMNEGLNTASSLNITPAAAPSTESSKTVEFDKSMYSAIATVNGKDINIPHGANSQLFVNQFALTQVLKDEYPEIYTKVKEEVDIRTNLLLLESASNTLSQKVYKTLTVTDEQITELYDVFVKSNDWRNGTIMVAKSNDKNDMVDFFEKLKVATTSKKGKLSSLVKKMDTAMKDGNFYEIEPGLKRLTSSLNEENKFTTPVRIGNEWMVFYLKDVKKIEPKSLDEVRGNLIAAKKRALLQQKLQSLVSPLNINLKLN